MTEPDAAGSDPRSLRTRAVRDGDSWVITGHKWMVSNARRADFAIVMCRTEDADGGGADNDRMTQIIVPTNAPGFAVVRDVPVWGSETGHHGEIVLDHVRVPLSNQLGARGSGHRAAQDRLGAGRVYHCMNCIGQMWRAFDLMVRRAMERDVHGGKLETDRKERARRLPPRRVVGLRGRRLAPARRHTVGSARGLRPRGNACSSRAISSVVSRSVPAAAFSAT